MAEGGGEDNSLAGAMANAVSSTVGQNFSALPGMLTSGWKKGLGLLGFQPNVDPTAAQHGYPNHQPANSLYDMVVGRPNKVPSMFSNFAGFGPGQRNFGLPQGANVNTDKMVSDIMSAMNTKGLLGGGFLSGKPETYASWGLNEKQAQDWEDQINNLDFNNWDSEVDITSKPAGQSANPHMDTVSISENTGAGFGPYIGQATGQTNINFGLPMGWNDPNIGIAGRGRGRAQQEQFAEVHPDRGDADEGNAFGGYGGWT